MLSVAALCLQSLHVLNLTRAQLLEDANLHAGGKHQKDYAVRVEEKLANMVVWNTQQEHNKMKRKVIVK